MKETPLHWTGPDRETFPEAKPVLTKTIGLRSRPMSYAVPALPVVTTEPDDMGPVIAVRHISHGEIMRPEHRKDLWRKSRTADAIAWRQDTWKTSDNDAIAPSDLDLARLTRRERRAAKYLDLIAKGKLKP